MRHSQEVTGVTGERVSRSTVPLAFWTDDPHGFENPMSRTGGTWGIGEVKQVAEKKITPKAASSTKSSSTGTAARVEKKSLKKRRMTKKKAK